jgi:hypothetical protein
MDLGLMHFRNSNMAASIMAKCSHATGVRTISVDWNFILNIFMTYKNVSTYSETEA